MHIAFLGLPKSGKSTLFEAIVEAFSEQSAGKGSSIKVRTGQARVVDPRITRLAEDFATRSTVYATLQFTDLQVPEGLVEHGKPLPAQLLNEYRGADALVLVVRAFEDANLFIANGVDPLRDARSAESELIFNDYAVMESRLSKIAEELKRGRKENEREQAVLQKLIAEVEAERPLRLFEIDPDDRAFLGSYGFLSLKPGLLVANAGEDGEVAQAAALEAWAKEHGLGFLILRGKVEQEIAALPEEERGEFLEMVGLTEPAAASFVRAAFETIGIQQFFTAGEQEVRAWTIRRGESAWDAAGAIHTDIQKHFIRAEVCAYTDYDAGGGMQGAKAAGKYRLEKKEYLVQEGDIIYFRHSG